MMDGVFIISSSGTGTFTRAHYLFCYLEQLRGKTRYIVTGNFGSEIFRAVHIPGVVISPNLISAFNAGNLKEAMQMIRMSNEMRYLNQHEFRTELNELEEEIETLPCFSAKHRSLTKNKQLYIFVLKRSYSVNIFGAELVSQFGSIKNRTPFLDIDFLRELLPTEFAGIHSGFLRGTLSKDTGDNCCMRISSESLSALGR